MRLKGLQECRQVRPLPGLYILDDNKLVRIQHPHEHVPFTKPPVEKGRGGM